MNEQSSSVPREIEAHYLETRESERLSGAHGELERLRTLEILARVLPPAPAVLFDVGGAAGAYAFPLSEQGYVVHLIGRGRRVNRIIAALACLVLAPIGASMAQSRSVLDSVNRYVAAHYRT